MLTKLRHIIFQQSGKIGTRFGIDLPYFIENGFWAVVNQLFVMISSLILSIIYARFLTKEVFGSFQLVVSILSIVSIVSLPGLSTSLSRSVAKGVDGVYKQSVRLSFKWSLLGVPILLSIAAFFVFKNQIEISIMLLICCLFFPFFYAPNTWSSFLIGKSKFETYAKWNAIQNAGGIVLLGITSYLFSEYLLIIILAYLIHTSIFNIIFYIRSHKFINNNIKETETIEYGKFITKMQILGIVVQQLDKLIVGMFNLELLAIYIIAFKLLDVVKNIVKSLFSITFPKFAQKSVSIKSYYILFLFITGAIFSLLLHLFSEPIIEILYTSKFEGSALFFKKIVWVIPFIIPYFFLVQKVTAQKKEKKVFQLQIIPQTIALLFAIITLILTNNLEYFVLCKIYVLYITSFFIVLKS